MSKPDKCRYCGHKYTCDITDANEIAACKVDYVVHSNSNAEARRRKQRAKASQ